MFVRLPFISAATHGHWLHIFCIAITDMGGGRVPCRLGYTQLRSAKLERLATSPVAVTSRSWLHFDVMPCAFLWKCLRCFVIKKLIVGVTQILRHRLLPLSSHLPGSDWHYAYEGRLISNARSEISRKRDHVFKQTKAGSKVQYFD